MQAGKINASGARADLSEYLPLRIQESQNSNGQTTNRIES